MIKSYTVTFIYIISVLSIMLCLPAYAVIIDTNAQIVPNNPTVKITLEQINEAVKNIPSNAPIIDPNAHIVNPTPLESDNNTQAIQLIIRQEQSANSDNKLHSNSSNLNIQNKPNHLKGLSITMALLGLVFGCFAFVLRKGPRQTEV